MNGIEKSGLEEAIKYLNKRGYINKGYKFSSSVMLPDPETDECKGYEYSFIKQEDDGASEIRIWYEIEDGGKVSCRGSDKIKMEKNYF